MNVAYCFFRNPHHSIAHKQRQTEAFWWEGRHILIKYTGGVMHLCQSAWVWICHITISLRECV